MSSILDALNKLEDEKAQADAIDDIDVYLESDHAAIEALTTSIVGDTRFPLRSIFIVAGIALFALVLVGASVGVSMMVLKSEKAIVDPGTTIASVPATPLAASLGDIAAALDLQTPPPAKSLQTPPLPEADALVPTPTQTPTPAVESPTNEQESATVKTAGTLSLPDAVNQAATRDNNLAEYQENLSRFTKEIVTPKAAEPLVTIPEEKVEPADERISSHDLPRLSEMVKLENGLEDIIVNWPHPASATHPLASAVINYSKYFVGERVGEYEIRLVAVEKDGVSLEMIRTGKRYFLKQ